MCFKIISPWYNVATPDGLRGIKSGLCQILGLTCPCGFHERTNPGDLFMLIASISSHPWRDDFLLYRPNAYSPRLTHSILSATYNKVSWRSASIATLRIYHHFPSSTPHPAYIYFQERKMEQWRGRSSKLSFDRVVHASRFLYALQSHQSKTSVATGRT